MPNLGACFTCSHIICVQPHVRDCGGGGVGSLRGRQWRQDGGGRWALTLRPKRSALSLIGTLSTSVPSFVTQMCAGRRGCAAKPGKRNAADDMLASCEKKGRGEL